MAASELWDQVSESIEFSAPIDISPLRDQLEPGSRVLDLGCGYGRISKELYELGFQVVGYDSSSKLIARGKAESPNLELRVGEASHIPEHGGSFQAVVAAALFTTVPNLEVRSNIVCEIQRLLSPGGIVCGVDFLQQNHISYSEGGLFLSTAGITMRHFQIAELERLFSEFICWNARKTPAVSLSGKPADVLQYSAQLPEIIEFPSQRQ